MKHILILTLVLTFLCIEVESKTIYVNNSLGDDRFTGEREDVDITGAGPVRTIAQATLLSSYGDTISLADTGIPYQESVSLAHKRGSGLSSACPFILEGNGAILDGRVIVPSEQWEHYCEINKPNKGTDEYQGDIFRLHVARLYPNAVKYCMIFIDSMPIQNKDLPQSELPVGQLNEMDAALSDGYLYFRPEKGKCPNDYKVEITALRAGITLCHVHNVVIRNLIIQGFQLDGVALSNSASDVVIERCTIRGNARSGVSVGNASDVKVKNILSCANAFSDVLTLPYSKVVVNQSRLSGDYGAPWVDESGNTYGSQAFFSNNGKWIKPTDLKPDLSPLPESSDTNVTEELNEDSNPADDSDSAPVAEEEAEEEKTGDATADNLFGEESPANTADSDTTDADNTEEDKADDTDSAPAEDNPFGAEPEADEPEADNADPDTDNDANNDADSDDPFGSFQQGTQN